VLKNNLYADRVIRVAVLQWREQHPDADANSADKWVWIAGFLAKWIAGHCPVDYAMRSELAALEEQLGVTDAQSQQSLW
jgi:hypothetical protein